MDGITGLNGMKCGKSILLILSIGLFLIFKNNRHRHRDAEDTERFFEIVLSALCDSVAHLCVSRLDVGIIGWARSWEILVRK